MVGYFLSMTAVTTPYLFNFNQAAVIEEAGKMDQSSSPDWWLSSGAKFTIENGVGRTIQGDLPAQDAWRKLYATTNPRDTDLGVHPQNIFRLVSRSRWLNYAQSFSFRIVKLHVSATPERDGWSGILLFNRCKDQDNLYYLGLRQDGTAIIKKKRFGIYYTLAQKRVFTGDAPYNKQTNPNLIPGQVWIGVKSVVKTQRDGGVRLQLLVDKGNRGNWQEAVAVTDTPGGPDGAPLLNQGYTGIRTDYMDVEFDDYRVERLY